METHIHRNICVSADLNNPWAVMPTNDWFYYITISTTYNDNDRNSIMLKAWTVCNKTNCI